MNTDVYHICLVLRVPAGDAGWLQQWYQRCIGIYLFQAETLHLWKPWPFLCQIWLLFRKAGLCLNVKRKTTGLEGVVWALFCSPSTCALLNVGVPGETVVQCL